MKPLAKQEWKELKSVPKKEASKKASSQAKKEEMMHTKAMKAE